MAQLEQSVSEKTLYRATIRLLSTVLFDRDVYQQADYYICDEQLTFSLAALYAQVKTAETISYNQYRRMIFSSSLNQDLLPYQLKVISHGIEPSTNTPLYRLVKFTGN